MTDTVLMMIALAVAGVVLWVWARQRRRREVLPQAPDPIQPNDDPNPAPESIDDLNTRMNATTHTLETYDARPTLPADFNLGGPDGRAVDLLRGSTGKRDD